MLDRGSATQWVGLLGRGGRNKNYLTKYFISTLKPNKKNNFSFGSWYIQCAWGHCFINFQVSFLCSPELRFLSLASTSPVKCSPASSSSLWKLQTRCAQHVEHKIAPGAFCSLLLWLFHCSRSQGNCFHLAVYCDSASFLLVKLLVEMSHLRENIISLQFRWCKYNCLSVQTCLFLAGRCLEYRRNIFLSVHEF